MLDWFVDRWNDLIDFLYALVLTIFDMMKEVAMWVFDMITALVVSILSGMDTMFDSLDVTSYFAMIPPETSAMLNAIGIGQATGMIVVSIGIRFLLQLIPFVRLGS